MTAASQSITIRAPIGRVFDVISDFGSYPTFLSEIEEAKVVRKGRAKTTVAFTATMVKRVRYTLAFTLRRPTRISWTLAEADPIMKGNSGSWELVALEKNLTDATFAAEIELGIWMPRAVIDGLVRAELPAMLRAFKRRAEEQA